VIIDNEIARKTKRSLADNITMEINDNSKKSKASVNFVSIINSLPSDTVNEHYNTNNEMYDAIVAETMLKVVFDTEME
jgi:hypothetical protein